MTIGLFSRRIKGGDDFIMGQRKIERLGTTMSIFATLMTESLIFFAVALTVFYGPLGGIMAIIGGSLALLIMSIIAPRAHANGVKNRFVCISEYCRQKWGKLTGQLSRMAFLLLLAWVIVLQINLNGNLLSGILGWTPMESSVLVVVVVLFYLLIGGYHSVIRTDVFQGILLGFILLLPLMISPRPNVIEAFDTRFLSVDVLLLFLMSFALTITRPELWQRIYSSKSGKIAARSLRIVALIYFIFGCFILYYALAVIQAAPDLSPTRAFAEGYRTILPPVISALFPVLLLAAMMSSLDSATFLLAADVTKIKSYFMKNPILWTRIFIVIFLIGGGLASLTIFNTLTFAYKINGIVALFMIPLLLSFWIEIPRNVLGISIAIGLITYVVQILIGRIDINPSEAILPALLTGFLLIVGYLIKWKDTHHSNHGSYRRGYRKGND